MPLEPVGVSTDLLDQAQTLLIKQKLHKGHDLQVQRIALPTAGELRKDTDIDHALDCNLLRLVGTDSERAYDMQQFTLGQGAGFVSRPDGTYDVPAVTKRTNERPWFH